MLNELVDPDDPPGVGVLPDLPSEGGEVRRPVDGELALVQDLVLEQVRDGDLGGGVEEHVVPLEVVHVVFQVGVLAGTDHRGLVDDHGREQLGVSLVLVGVQEVVDEGPLEPGPVALQAVESASGDLDGPVEVDDAKVLGDLPVLPGFEVELPLLPLLVHDDVVVLVLPDGDGLVGDVGDVEDAVLADVLELGHPLVVGLDLVGDLPHLPDARVLLLALGHLGDLQGDLVPGLPEAVVLVGERPPLGVGVEEPVEDRVVLVPVLKHGPDHVRV